MILYIENKLHMLEWWGRGDAQPCFLNLSNQLV